MNSLLSVPKSGGCYAFFKQRDIELYSTKGKQLTKDCKFSK